MMVTLLCSALATCHPDNSPPPLQKEFRAAWVATVDNIDWPSKRNLSTTEQQVELIRILDTARSTHLNAIILQVRPSADALYDSRLEPWSEYLTGRQGRRPQPYYDPLEFAVREAHHRGLELHCWFNPYRALHPAQQGPLASRHVALTHPRIVKQYGPYLWMDPGEPEVQRRTMAVMLDVVRRYDIDGIHIDDYFYPYKEKGKDGKTIDFPDDESFARYQREGGQLPRDGWRRKNVDDFIEHLYQGIKREKKWVKFGISPFGIWRPGYPVGIKAGVDQYGDLYADARKWLQNGWCDYFTPQLYWPLKQRAQGYTALLDWWMQQNPLGRHLWPGNFTSRTDPSDGNWAASEVENQIIATRTHHAAGNVHFSMKAFLQNWNGITDRLRSKTYATTALVPPSPWLEENPPKAISIRVRQEGDRHWTVSWKSSKDVRFFEVAVEVEGKWQPASVSDAYSLEIEQQIGAATRVAVTAIDKTGVEGPTAFASLE